MSGSDLRRAALAAACSALLSLSGAPAAAADPGALGAVRAVRGLDCVHARPWVCAAPSGSVTFALAFAASTSALVPGRLPFTIEGTNASIAFGTPTPTTAGGLALAVTVHPAHAGILTLAMGQPAVLTVYLGAGRLPPWPGTARIAVPATNRTPPAAAVDPFLSADAVASLYLTAIADARRAEGVPAWHLPSDFAALSAVDQLFVLTNLERTSRGLWPLWGVSPALDAEARAGARARTDPVATGTNAAWGSNWFSGTDVAEAVFGWMYDDGPGRFDENLDCPRPGASGCWGHRDNVLGNWGPYGLFGGAVVAGGGTAELMVQGVVPERGGLTYTWADAVRMGARPAD